MLEQIKDLPSNVLGVRATGEVTLEDYENVLTPMLSNERNQGHHIRFLYQFGPNFSRFSVKGAWEDLRVGLKYLRLFDRCAVVSDVDWIQNATQLMGSLMPCPTRTFENKDLRMAIDWLASTKIESNLEFEFLEEGILVVRPKNTLKRADFDRLSEVVDPWIEAHHKLKGLALVIERFPGWENIGSFIRHMEFVGAHHKKVEHVAVVADGRLPHLMTDLAKHFVVAEIKQFPYQDINEAIAWTKEGGKVGKPSEQ